MTGNEINPIHGLSPTNFFGGQKTAANFSNLRTGISKNQIDSFQAFSSGEFSGKELQPMITILASKLQISELAAFKLLRKFMATGQASSFTELKSFMEEFLRDPSLTAKPNQLYKDLGKTDLKGKSDADLEKVFKPVIRDMQDKFLDMSLAKQAANNKPVDQMAYSRYQQSAFNAADQAKLTKLATSPKEFASWLVNNKAAFISLKSNPQVTKILTAMQNPRIQESPALMAQLISLMVQLLKIKASKTSMGGSSNEEISEQVTEDREQDLVRKASDHERGIVNNVKRTVETVPISPLREFLIEAERFAEEEVANLWSLTLKKEKELEKQLKKGFDAFKKK